MKRAMTIILCLLLTAASCFGASAYDASPTSETQITQTVTETDSNITIIEELIVQENARSSTRSATRRQTFMKGDDTIAVIALSATFSYDGSSVSVVSKSVSQCDTYNGWSFSRNSLTSVGGTATLTGQLTKLLNRPVNVNISITCDKNGNVS